MIDGIAAATSHPDGARARMTRNVPLGRLGTRAEVAAHRLPVVRRVFVTGGESPSTAGSQFAVIVLRRPPRRRGPRTTVRWCVGTAVVIGSRSRGDGTGAK